MKIMEIGGFGFGLLASLAAAMPIVGLYGTGLEQHGTIGIGRYPGSETGPFRPGRAALRTPYRDRGNWNVSPFAPRYPLDGSCLGPRIRLTFAVDSPPQDAYWQVSLPSRDARRLVSPTRRPFTIGGEHSTRTARHFDYALAAEQYQSSTFF